jgi:hypothetical protein
MKQQRMTIDEYRREVGQAEPIKKPVHVPGTMNRLERAFAIHLDGMKSDALVAQWWFERMTFKLADDCRYTPDFVATVADGSIHAYEVKGPHVRDDARVKYKTAAEMFPFIRWHWCTQLDGQWTIKAYR